MEGVKDQDGASQLRAAETGCNDANTAQAVGACASAVPAGTSPPTSPPSTIRPRVVSTPGPPRTLLLTSAPTTAGCWSHAPRGAASR